MLDDSRVKPSASHGLGGFRPGRSRCSGCGARRGTTPRRPGTERQPSQPSPRLLPGQDGRIDQDGPGDRRASGVTARSLSKPKITTCSPTPIWGRRTCHAGSGGHRVQKVRRSGQPVQGSAEGSNGHAAPAEQASPCGDGGQPWLGVGAGRLPLAPEVRRVPAGLGSDSRGEIPAPDHCDYQDKSVSGRSVLRASDNRRSAAGRTTLKGGAAEARPAAGDGNKGAGRPGWKRFQPEMAGSGLKAKTCRARMRQKVGHRRNPGRCRMLGLGRLPRAPVSDQVRKRWGRWAQFRRKGGEVRADSAVYWAAAFV